MSNKISIILFALLIFQLNKGINGATNNLWPQPQIFQENGSEQLILNQSNFTYQLNTCQANQNLAANVQQIFQKYFSYIFQLNLNHHGFVKTQIEASNNEIPFSNTFLQSHKDQHQKSNLQSGSNYQTLQINIQSCKMNSQSSNTSEYYELYANNSGIQIKASTYVGFLRGIETFSQLVQQIQVNNSEIQQIIFNTPIVIQDQPKFQYRGLMLDSSRHFLSVEQIIHTIDAMLQNKMNILHLHLTDGDSFPLYIKSLPELSQFGSFNPEEVYSQFDIQNIINYATQNGVRVIPELDTPSHARSWGLSDKYKDIIACGDVGANWQQYCPTPPCGQLDPTNDLTYEVVKQVFSDLKEYFPDEYVHVGGDEIQVSCWQNKQSIVDYAKKHGISDLRQLEYIYREKLRNLIDANKRRIYWYNDLTSSNFTNNEILQYWGSAADLSKLYSVLPNNQLILSPYDITYLDCGFGNLLGGNAWCPTMTTWKQIYDGSKIMLNQADPSRVLGAEMCMWGELNNAQTLNQKVWPRSSVMAEQLWNPNVQNSQTLLVQRLQAQINRMIKRNVQASPITSEYCSRNLNDCF